MFINGSIISPPPLVLAPLRYLCPCTALPGETSFPNQKRRRFNSILTLPAATFTLVITSWASGRSRSTTSTVTRFHGVLALWRYSSLLWFPNRQDFSCSPVLVFPVCSCGYSSIRLSLVSWGLIPGSKSASCGARGIWADIG